MNYDIHSADSDIQPPQQAIHHFTVEREDRRRDRRRNPPRVIRIDNEEGRYNIPGRNGRRDSPRVIFDNDGGHCNISGRDGEAEPTYANAQNTASKYYEGGFGDRAWRKKKLERIGRRHPPRIDPKREPPQSSK